MAIIGARASEWQTDNSEVRPLRWLAACAYLASFAVLVPLGSIINGG